MPLDPLGLPYSLFRVAAIALSLLACLFLAGRPKPRWALSLVLLLHLAGWAAYVAPLARLYGLQEHNDRGFNVGMAAVAAAGNSPFEHTQAGFANLEPFWSFAVALLARMRPENVISVYGALAPLSLVLVGLATYRGLRLAGEGDVGRWERALSVFSVLGLSSFSLSQRGPIQPFWAANFLYKPNHAIGFALVAVAIGLCLPRVRTLALGLVLGLLAWMFLLHWAFLLPGLVVGTWLRPVAEREWKKLGAAIGLSAAIAVPYVAHLARDYNPLAAGGSPEQIWLDSLGQRLAPPHWATLDLGILFVLGGLGAIALWRRRNARDAMLLGLLATTWLMWLGYLAGALVNFTPEPDEHHYFLRFAMALAAGAALAALARHIEGLRDLPEGAGHALALALFLPLSFVASWDPPSMDRYFRWDVVPIGPKVQAYGRWVRENTPPRAVFVAGRNACMWIPVFSGRRVLLAAESRPPKDYAARKEAERMLLLSNDPALIRRVAERFDVSYLAIDREMLLEYGEESLEGLGRLPVYEPVYRSSAVRILKIRR